MVDFVELPPEIWDAMSDTEQEQLDESEHTRGEKFLSTILDKEFASYKEYIMNKYGDQFGHHDFVPTKFFKTSEDAAKWQIWCYMIRGAIQDIAGFGPEIIEHEFEAIYFQIAAMHLGKEGFNKRYKPLAIQIEDEKSDREWKAKLKKINKG